MHRMTLHITTNLLAQAVRAHRESRGFSLGALAEKASISKTSLSKIEAGLGNPSLDVLCRIASALDVPVGTLFGEESRPQLQVIPRDEGQVITSESGLAIWPILTQCRNQHTEIYHLYRRRSFPWSGRTGSASATRRLRLVLCRSSPLLHLDEWGARILSDEIPSRSWHLAMKSLPHIRH